MLHFTGHFVKTEKYNKLNKKEIRMRTVKKRRVYSKEFKKESVQLILIDPDQPISQISKNLGIPETVLRRWKKEYQLKGEHSFPGHGIINQSEAEVYELKKELARTQRERDILKKALAIFSKTPE